MKKHFKMFVLLSFMLIFSVLAQAFDNLPDTGQIKCYNNTVEITPCPAEGESFYGQDASYNINQQSYTKLDASGNDLADNASSWIMVRDNVTGLIWEAKTNDGTIHDKDNIYTWCDTNDATNGGDEGTCGDGTDTTDFIATLNTANYGGHNDWRLPTIIELATIVNGNRDHPAINITFFPNTVQDHYWSSTTDVSSIDSAWIVWFTFGHVGSISSTGMLKSNSYYVRAVRGGNTTTNLVDNGNGTVTDTSTGLMWQQATQPQKTWEAALADCESLLLAGHKDWRLPNRNELHSIVDYSRDAPAIDPSFFPGTISGWYWSSTTATYNTMYTWRVYFDSGYVHAYFKASGSHFDYARAVRTVSNANLSAINLLLLQQ